MDFIQNVPFFSIMISMFSGIVSSVLSEKWAKRLNTAVILAVGVMSGALLLWLCKTGCGSYIFMMGHFPAPWGNEIRAGVLEAGMAMFFCIVMLLSMTGGRKKLFDEVEYSKHNIYYILVDMMLSSLLALIYTNDLFTAYVFVEINTIAGCGLIMIRQVGRSFTSAIRYLMMSQLGSGLFLIGLSLLYDVTGHLLMSPTREAVRSLVISGRYEIPLLVILAVISVGLAIKSGLYPFHSWIPDTYGYATPTASAILSGLVSKGYIFLLIKIFYRVLGFETVVASRIVNVLYFFGLAGMIMGSVRAIMQTDTRRMIAYSSVAQIGYIYMGLGLGTTSGVVAAVFHMFTHSATKALLFISAVGLYEVSGDKKDYHSLRGAGYRNPLAAVGFTVGALSMVGFPMLSGFISKLLFASSALLTPGKMLPTMIGLAVSTVLNAIYFLRLVITIFSPAGEKQEVTEAAKRPKSARVMLGGAICCFILLNLVLGCFSQPIVRAISSGLAMFD